MLLYEYRAQYNDDKSSSFNCLTAVCYAYKRSHAEQNLLAKCLGREGETKTN